MYVCNGMLSWKSLLKLGQLPKNWWVMKTHRQTHRRDQFIPLTADVEKLLKLRYITFMFSSSALLFLALFKEKKPLDIFITHIRGGSIGGSSTALQFLKWTIFILQPVRVLFYIIQWDFKLFPFSSLKKKGLFHFTFYILTPLILHEGITITAGTNSTDRV